MDRVLPTGKQFMSDPASSPPAPSSKALLWTGYIVSALPVLGLIASAVMKFGKPAFVVEGMDKHGYPEGIIVGLGVVELACTLLYIIPQTSVLGAILLTGYLGGATATHVRVGEFSQAIFGPVLFGVLIWLGLFLRDSRLRALVPLRR
jgi:DoxX-like protein